MAYYTIKDLENLVKSLSGAEKRYFSLNNKGTFNSEKLPNYLALYNSLYKGQTEIPEFTNSFSPEAGTTAKKQLFQQIMKSLRAFHDESSPEIILENHLIGIAILHNLNLPGQSLLLLQKARKLAHEHEYYDLLLRVLEWERRLDIVADTPRRSSAEIRKEERTVLSRLTQILEMETIYGRAKELKRQYGYVKGKLKRNLERETIHAKGMPTLSECQSNKARYYYHFIHALYYWMTFDHANAYGYSRELLHPKIKVVIPNDYADGILEHVTSCVCLGKFDDALNGLLVAELYMEEQKLNQSHAYRLKLFYYQVSYHIIIYNYTGDRNKLLQTIKQTEERLKIFDSQLSFEMRQVVLGNLMNAYLGVGNFRKVDELFDTLFRKSSQTARRDIYDDLYLFRLLNLLQSKTYALLPSMAQAAYSYYKKFKDHDTHFVLELQIATLLKKNWNYAKRDVKREILSQIQLLIGQYMHGLKGLNAFQEHYTLYMIWIESLLSESPFYMEAQKWYNTYKK